MTIMRHDHFETWHFSYSNHYETWPFWDMTFFLQQPLRDMTILRHGIFPTSTIMRHEHFETWHFSYINHYETWPFWDLTILRADVFSTAIIMKDGRLETWFFCHHIIWSKKKIFPLPVRPKSVPWWWKFKTIQWISFMGKSILSKFVIVLKTCDIWLALH